MIKGVFSALALFLSLSAAAQQAQLLTREGPHYAGVPVEVQIVADGFEEAPQPTVQATAPAGGQLEFAGISPNISTSIQIINGRVTQSKTVRFVFHYRFLADQPGDYVLGPFRVTQTGKEASTRTVALRIAEIPVAGNQRIQLLLPDGPVYVGQRVPVRLEWWVNAELRGKLYNQRTQLPLLAMRGEFQFAEVPSGGANASLVIETPTGPNEFSATARLDSWQGEQYVVYTVSLTITPLKAGEHALEPATVTVDEAVRWRRDLFGQRTPTHSRKLRTVDSERTLVVQAPPAASRPASFTGAVGRGFILEAATDRSVVQVGDPITLTLTLRGDAAMENVALPPLMASGLSPESFRLPENEIAGVYQDGSKRFQTTIRVLDEAVREIPSLAFSWFDPDSGDYQTTRSQPIALSVRAAQVVSADDVVSGASQDGDAQTLPEDRQPTTDLTNETGPSDRPGRRPAFTLSGADLAIVQDLDTLLAPGGSRLGSAPIQIICYTLGILAVGLAVFGRRRASIDPATVARLKELKQQRGSVEKATAVAEIAAALRRMAAAATGFPRREFDSLLAECDNRVYAPDSDATQVDDALRRRALALADTMLEGAR